jgi:cation diffusion facilitator CzcD-associated flavoprotein CzcO
MTTHNHVAIIGTGFGGIATAIRRRQAGVTDVVLLDRASDVGGAWRDNDYPGAAVDVESSNLYSFSFASGRWNRCVGGPLSLLCELRLGSRTRRAR